ncbi:hypothetical protein, partial [Bacillus subtilis]|uniref:hypothetical protein n=1 Tax=Bacillus subtilis TaxID=1423 RepID=UPI0011A6CC05
MEEYVQGRERKGEVEETFELGGEEVEEREKGVGGGWWGIVEDRERKDKEGGVRGYDEREGEEQEEGK